MYNKIMGMTFLFNPLGRLAGQDNVSQLFGKNPEAYKRFGLEGHNGLDLAVPVGTPVRCIANTEGRVIEAAWNNVGNRCPALGKWVKVQHEPNERWPNGYCTLYAHLDQPELSKGNRVSPGQYIGLSGNTGNSTGPHLHVGIQPLPRLNNGYGGYVDFVDLISWNADPMPAYVNRYNPHRKVQGLPEISETLTGQFGEDSDYGVLTEEQAFNDRKLLSPGTPPAEERRNIYRILPEMLDVIAHSRWEPYVAELTAICVIESGNRLARHNGRELVRRFETYQWNKHWPDTPVPDGWESVEKCYVTSWGIAQIMGWHFKRFGKSDALDFKRWLAESGHNEIRSLVDFLETKGLYGVVAGHDWETLAYKYNGAGHARNNWTGKFTDALAAVKRENKGVSSKPMRSLYKASKVLEVSEEDAPAKAIVKLVAAWLTKSATRGTVGIGLLAGLWSMPPVQEAVLSGFESPLVRQLIAGVVSDMVGETAVQTPVPIPAPIVSEVEAIEEEVESTDEEEAWLSGAVLSPYNVRSIPENTGAEGVVTVIREHTAAKVRNHNGPWFEVELDNGVRGFVWHTGVLVNEK